MEGEAREKGWNKSGLVRVYEGIAFDNGTQLMTAIAALTVCDAETLIETAEIAAALSLEALLGISDAFDERIHEVRPRKGQAYFACESTWHCLIVENFWAKVLNILQYINILRS